MTPELRELALAGAWNDAIELAVAEIKDKVSAVEIAGWLIEGGFYDCSLSAATTRVYGCLNPRKAEFFKLPEWWHIQKMAKCTTLLELECMYLSLSCPREIVEERERAQLERRRKSLASEISEIDALLTNGIPPRKSQRSRGVSYLHVDVTQPKDGY